MQEIIGPVLAVYVYSEKEWESTLCLINDTSPYGLTGNMFARNRDVVRKSMDILRHAAGNFYINDKSTGSGVGQQPFRGARERERMCFYFIPVVISQGQWINYSKSVKHLLNKKKLNANQITHK